MSRANERKRDFDKVADIVRDAGGKIVGRTRLQKIAYLLELAGVGEGFTFEYRHYGPYSEELALATSIADLLGALCEQERETSWGGSYSIFTAEGRAVTPPGRGRVELAHEAVNADPVELELAATAAFLAAEGESDPWGETVKRKPEKAQPDALEGAKTLYRKLLRIQTLRPLPKIV